MGFGMAIAAIGSIGGAFQAASAFLGLRAERDTLGDPPVFVMDRDAGEAWPGETVSAVLDPAFAPGSAYFEAVAAALGEAGYLDA